MIKPGSKKSETLEVRISYETKQKLSERAQAETQTVSEIIRRLIASYLSSPESIPVASPTRPNINNMSKSIVDFIIKKPKSTFASVLALAASSLIFIPPATAEEFILDIHGEYVEANQTNPSSVRTRRFNTRLLLDFGSTSLIGFDRQAFLQESTLLQDGLWIKIAVEETNILKMENAVSFTLFIIEKTEGQETVIAKPTLTAAYDETTAYMTERDDGKIYSFKFIPKSKS